MKYYSTLDGQTIYDIAAAIYGDQRGVSVIIDNNVIDLNNPIPAQTQILYDETVIYKKQVLKTTLSDIPRHPFTVLADQSLYDLAIQLYGEASGIATILMSGFVSDINSVMPVGSKISPQDSDNILANNVFNNVKVQTCASHPIYLTNDAGTFILTSDDGTQILTP